LVQDRGGAEFKTAGNLLVVEDLKRGTNKDIGPKDIFETASNNFQYFARKIIPIFRDDPYQELSAFTMCWI
jgi:hypothetical protein